MNEARPFASLSSGLLARKGAAKPGDAPAGLRPAWRLRGSRLERHGPASPPRSSTASCPSMCRARSPALTPGAQAPARGRERPSPRWSPSSARSPRASPPKRRPSPSRPEPEPEPAPEPVEAPGRGGRAAEAPAAGRRGAGQEGRLHPARRCRAPSSPPPRHRRHRPVGAAAGDRGARSVACVHSRNRIAGRAGSRLRRQEKLTQKRPKR